MPRHPGLFSIPIVMHDQQVAMAEPRAAERSPPAIRAAPGLPPVHVEPPAAPGHPPCLVFRRRDTEARAAAPVRIFLGTEDGQARALRVFLYSVAVHRNPGREYRIYLMKNLPGFDRSRWRTGFTMYRFAIPEFAGFAGRAIYNDVDQIYLTDPARLYDLSLDGCGYRAISREDTSVMLLDCEQMGGLWNLPDAQGRSKRDLTRASAASGLWQPLDRRWNARDGEYVAGETGVLHYTALHLQPWTPEPGRYSYHAHPLRDVWLDLERAADAAGFGPFSAEIPSPWFDEARKALGVQPDETQPASPEAEALMVRTGSRELLCCGSGPLRSPFSPSQADAVRHWSLSDDPWPEEPADAVAAWHVLEHLPAEDVPWLLDALCGRARRLLCLAVAEEPPPSAHDRPGASRPEAWWKRELRRAAARHPHLYWHLDFRPAGGRASIRVQAPPRRDLDLPDRQPRVWVLTGHRFGDSKQLRSLAGALGWPWEEKHLVYNPLHHCPNFLLGETVASIDRQRSSALEPPWPDLVIGCGKRSVPVARWIRRQNGGRTQLVHLGRPWAPLSLFDLVVTTPQYGLPLRDNVHVNLLPLNRPEGQARQEEISRWQAELEGLPRPWIGVLVGGGSYPYRFRDEDARRLGRRISEMAGAQKGAVLVSTSPRTPERVATALFGAIDAPAHLHRWHPGSTAVDAYLALCDQFVVTSDSASMLAETVATGRPVQVFVLSEHLPRLRQWLHRVMQAIGGQARRPGSRGTPKQQTWPGRLRDALVASGTLQTFRDMGHLQQQLRARGAVRPLGGPAGTASETSMSDELSLTVARIRRRMGERRWTAPPLSEPQRTDPP